MNTVAMEMVAINVMELELEFYLFDRQLHNIGEIISKNVWNNSVRRLS